MKFVFRFNLLLVLLVFISISASSELVSLKEYYKLSEKKFNEGDYTEALRLTIKARILAEKNSICEEIAYANLQVAKMQYYLNKKNLALSTFLFTEKIIDSCNIDSLRYKVYHNIGSIYSELKQLESGLIYLKKSLNILSKSKRYIELARTNAVIASIYIERMDNSKDGDKYLVNAEKFAKMSNDSLIIAYTITKRGRWYYGKKNFEKALELYYQSLSIYQSLNNANGILYSYRAIADTKAILKTDDVMDSYRKYILLKDSIFNAESAKKIAEYEVQYETEKQEIENKMLQQKIELNQVEIKNRNKTIIGLIVGILLVITFILLRINKLNLRKKQAELAALESIQKEKERISRDLHDNVGGQLTYVLYSLDGINEENSTKRKELALTINETVRSVISNLRETIWAINDERISLSDFSDKLKLYTRNIFRNNSTKVIFSENIKSDRYLKSIIGLNLYRICQEIMNNAFKYAKASEITISINSEDTTSVLISDNGVGFNVDEKYGSGFGLTNIINRAKEVGIQIKIISEIGKGTTYTLVV